MNSVPAIEPVGSASQGPLATLQAMRSLLAEPQQAADAAGAMQARSTSAVPGVDGDVAGQPTQNGALPQATPAGPQDAQEVQRSRNTLGLLAAEQAPTRTGPDPAVAVRHGLLPEPAPSGSPTQRLVDAVAVPVLVSALHSPAIAQQPPRETRGPRRHDAGAGGEEPRLPGGEATHDEREQAAAGSGDAACEEADALRQWLQRSGRVDALTDLARGRRVLLVVAGQTKAILLGPRQVQRFAAQWTAGPEGSADWQQWRVFRDGDPLLTRGLRSRGGHACRVLLGPAPGGSVVDAPATLAIGDRIRFTHALGGQWSLLLLAAPGGALW